jgi:hypothetical protein
MQAAGTYGRRMSVPITTSPETGLPQRRSHIRRWLTAAAASAIIGAAGIVIATGDEPDASRPPSSNPPSSETTLPKNYPWRYNDPRVVKGARGKPIR